MKNHVRWLMNVAGILCIALYLSGCAHEQVNTDQSMKMSKSDMKYKAVHVANFTVSPKGVQEDEPGEFLSDAQASCFDELTKSGMFDNVGHGTEADSANSGLIVQGELTKMRIVGGGARFFIGGMAGKSNMTVHVKLVDSTTGAVIAERNISEDTNPTVGAWSMGGTDRALPAIVGALIAQYVVESAKN